MSYIPANIIYICRNSIFDKRLNLNLIPAFVTDPTNEKTVQTGIEWAKNSYAYYNQPRIPNPKQIIMQNDPISNIRLIELDHRGRGRAYKIIANGFYVDLREDIMLDCLLHEGCVGGIFQSQFVWARIASQMKLIRVGSELHKSLK